MFKELINVSGKVEWHQVSEFTCSSNHHHRERDATHTPILPHI